MYNICNRIMASVDGPYFIGVDVGTNSVRAALVTSSGHLVCSASCAITLWEPEPNFYEQSSSNIWQACCTVVRVSLVCFRLISVYLFLVAMQLGQVSQRSTERNMHKLLQVYFLQAKCTCWYLTDCQITEVNTDVHNYSFSLIVVVALCWT